MAAKHTTVKVKACKRAIMINTEFFHILKFFYFEYAEKCILFSCNIDKNKEKAVFNLMTFTESV